MVRTPWFDYTEAVGFVASLLQLCAPSRFRCRGCKRFMSRHAHSFMVAPTARPSMTFADVVAATQDVPLVDRVRWCTSCTLALPGVSQTVALSDRLSGVWRADVTGRTELGQTTRLGFGGPRRERKKNASL